jgi:iron complex transport system ATP-binding protein
MEQVIKAIEARNITFAYNDSVVLENAEVEIEARKLTFILGRNGSGKSTLLRIFAGLLRLQKGVVQIMGKDISGLSYTERSRLTGFLNQQHQAVFPFSVEEVVLTGRAGHINFLPGQSDREAAMEAIDRAGIMHLRNRNYTELSGGEQQLVMIARLLAQNPEILLLDEPTTHLDFSNQSHLLVLLKQLVTEGLTIVAVMHDPNMSFMFGDDFLFVKEKKVIRQGASLRPWDAGFLETIYHADIETIPYGGRAIIIPKLPVE